MERVQEIYERILKKGEAAIDEFIETRESEHMFLDFKRSADNGAGRRLHPNDRANLAKAISGFGNSEGGVIVWGVDCSKCTDHADVARAKHPIQNVRRFVSWLQGAVSGCTVPPHTEVTHDSIAADDKGAGFPLTYIPKSNSAPHQVVGRSQYYIRAGSDFVPAPHAVLAGMFGRRPQPNVCNMYVITPATVVADENVHFQIGFQIANMGPGIARDIFLVLKINSLPGDNWKMQFPEPPDTNIWTGTFSFGRHMSVISKPGIRLAPEAFLMPFTLETKMAPPFSKQLNIEGICGGSGSPTQRFAFQNTPGRIKRLYERFLERHQSNRLTEKDGHRFVEKVVGLAKAQRN